MDINAENINSSGEYEQFITDLRNAKDDHSLFCFIGAGVGISQLYPDWNAYVKGLIDYWIYELKVIVEDKRAQIKEVDQRDMRFLQLLNKSNMSNKRKVDLVLHLILNYCKTDNPDITLVLFNEYALRFENYLFSQLAPIIPRNSILEEIIKLRPLIITTNYDQEIEKAYIRVLNTICATKKDISDTPNIPEPDMVLHLHGVPDCNDKNLFISSSRSYSNLYYRDPMGYIGKVRNLFSEKKNALVLFIGCSMEEDEVLSIFEFENTNIKYYSLMRYTKYSDEKIINDIYNEKIKEYYQSRKIKFIWYGLSYSDLQDFSHKIVEQVLLDSNGNTNFEKLKRELTDV